MATGALNGAGASAHGAVRPAHQRPGNGRCGLFVFCRDSHLDIGCAAGAGRHWAAALKAVRIAQPPVETERYFLAGTMHDVADELDHGGGPQRSPIICFTGS
jgi:hypothetical protein